MQPSEGALDDPADASEAGAVLGPAAGNDRFDASRADEAPVGVVVVATVGDDCIGAKARPADYAAHARHLVEQRDQLGHVVAVAARERPGQRQPAAVYEEMLFAAAAAPVDGAGADFLAPFFAWI